MRDHAYSNEVIVKLAEERLQKADESFSRRSSERSFTLFETVVALAIMSAMMVELIGLNANTIYFSEFASKVVRATLLAKRVMSQVEYYSRTRDFALLKVDEPEAKFEDEPDFTYKLRIQEWKLPIEKILAGDAGAEKTEGEPTTESGGNPEASMISAAIKQILGDDLLRVAHVEVFWPEGAGRNSVSLSLLLTNQSKIDQAIATQKSAYDELEKKGQTGTGTPPPPPNPPNSTSSPSPRPSNAPSFPQP